LIWGWALFLVDQAEDQRVSVSGAAPRRLIALRDQID